MALSRAQRDLSFGSDQEGRWRTSVVTYESAELSDPKRRCNAAGTRSAGWCSSSASPAQDSDCSVDAKPQAVAWGWKRITPVLGQYRE